MERQRPETGERQEQRKHIRLLLEDLCPNYPGNGIFSRRTPTHLTWEKGRTGEKFGFFMEYPFDARNIDLLLMSFSDQPYSRQEVNKIWAGEMREEDVRGVFRQHKDMLLDVMRRGETTHKLEEMAGRVKTWGEAWMQFVSDRNLSKMLVDVSSETDKSFLLADIASGIAAVMRKHPELWKERAKNTKKSSDRRGLNRFRQLQAVEVRRRVFEEELERFPQEMREEIIRRRITGLYGGIEWQTASGRKGFILKDASGITVEQVGDEAIRLEINEGIHRTEMVFDAGNGTFDCAINPENKFLIPGFYWTKTAGKRTGSFSSFNQVPIAKIETHLARNPKVKFTYNVSDEQVNSLLGFLSIAHLSPDSYRYWGEFQAYLAPIVALQHRELVLDCDLIRNIEKAIHSAKIGN